MGSDFLFILRVSAEDQSREGSGGLPRSHPRQVEGRGILLPGGGALLGKAGQSQSIAQKHNCVLRRLDYQQEQGLMSSLPLGLNQIAIQRGLTTSSTAIFIPFITQVRP